MTAGDYLSRLAAALPLVLLLLAGLWLAAKRGWIAVPGAAADAAGLRAAATLAIGPGAKLVVVEFDGARLLVAASRSGVTLLDARGQCHCQSASRDSFPNRHPRESGDPMSQCLTLAPRFRGDDGEERGDHGSKSADDGRSLRSGHAGTPR